MTEAPAQVAFTLPAQPDEADARNLVAALGLASPFAVLKTPEDAHALPYPVALKILSPDLAHKTEVGGVKLNIPDASALKQQAAAMQAQMHHIQRMMQMQQFGQVPYGAGTIGDGPLPGSLSGGNSMHSLPGANPNVGDGFFGSAPSSAARVAACAVRSCSSARRIDVTSAPSASTTAWRAARVDARVRRRDSSSPGCAAASRAAASSAVSDATCRAAAAAAASPSTRACARALRSSAAASA